MAQASLLKRLKEAVVSESDQSITWTWDTTLQARGALGHMKSTGRGPVSAEVLQALSAEAMRAIHLMRQAHFMSFQGSRTTWRHSRLFLLPKVRRPEDWSDVRGICLLNVMSKLYMAGVMRLIRDWTSQHLGAAWGAPLLFGFEADCKCEDLLLFAAGSACRRRMADETPSGEREYGREASVRLLVSGCRRRQYGFLEISGSLGARPCQRKLGGHSRGDLRRPSALGALWDEQMCTPRRPRVALVLQPRHSDHHDGRDWRWRGSGLTLPILGAVPLVEWADNIAFVGTSASDTQPIGGGFTDALHARSMQWKASSMQFITAGRQELPDSVPGQNLAWPDSTGARHHFEQVEQLELLGSILSLSPREAIQHRLAKASAAFWGDKDFSLRRGIEWKHKLSEYVKRIRSAALYVSPTWTWNSELSHLLKSWENSILRRLCYDVWHRDSESFGDWRRRHTRMAQDKLLEAGQRDSLQAFLGRQYRWMRSALRRFAFDLLSQTRGRTWPSEAAWQHIFSSMREGSLTSSRAVDCAPVCFLTPSDEEGWRVKQASMMTIDPHNAAAQPPMTCAAMGRCLPSCMGPAVEGTIVERDNTQRRGSLCDCREEAYATAALAQVGRAERSAPDRHPRRRRHSPSRPRRARSPTSRPKSRRSTRLRAAPLRHTGRGSSPSQPDSLGHRLHVDVAVA